jgi:predicted PurR-regulated permease PerM
LQLSTISNNLTASIKDLNDVEQQLTHGSIKKNYIYHIFFPQVSTISNNLAASIQNLTDVEQQLARVQQQQGELQQAEQAAEQQQQQQAMEEEDWAPDLVSRRSVGLLLYRIIVIVLLVYN